MDHTQVLLRLRASLFKGEQLSAQTTLVTRANAPSPDAAGGVKALTAAADEAAKLLGSWVAGLAK
jgi:cholesterol transport system auxiliary component